MISILEVGKMKWEISARNERIYYWE